MKLKYNDLVEVRDSFDSLLKDGPSNMAVELAFNSVECTSLLVKLEKVRNALLEKFGFHKDGVLVNEIDPQGRPMVIIPLENRPAFNTQFEKFSTEEHEVKLFLFKASSFRNKEMMGKPLVALMRTGVIESDVKPT